MRIGITGSIATGKSTVTKYLMNKGYTVVDSDKIVHNLLKNGEILLEISTVFGSDLIVDNKLDRKKLGNIIFNNEEKRKKLNNIVHPKVILEIEKKTLKYLYNNKIIFVDIPLLFEANLEYLVDKIIVVFAPLDIQVERLMKRDNIDKEYALKKIKASLDIEYKKSKADYLIDNSSGLEDTYKNIDEILRRINNES